MTESRRAARASRGDQRAHRDIRPWLRQWGRHVDARHALRIGRHTLGSPFVLAPMAGITNRAFRRLCREYAGGGVYVSEMVTSRALVERHPETMRLVEHDPDEHPRSVQLYGVDPVVMAAAVRLLVEEDRADHIDLNVGCPVPKVTRKGGERPCRGRRTSSRPSSAPPSGRRAGMTSPSR